MVYLRIYIYIHLHLYRVGSWSLIVKTCSIFPQTTRHQDAKLQFANDFKGSSRMWTETVKIDYGNEGIGGKSGTISVTYPLTTTDTRIFASQNDENTVWRIEALIVDVLAFPFLQGDSDRWCSQSTGQLYGTRIYAVYHVHQD